MGAKAEDYDEGFDPELPPLPSGAPLKLPGRRISSTNDQKVAKKKKIRPKAKSSESPLEKSMRLSKRFIDPKYHEVHDEADDNGKHKGTFADANIVHTPASGTTLLASKDRYSPSDPLKSMSFKDIE